MFCPKDQQSKEYSLHWLNIEDFPEIVCLWKGTKPIFHDRVADDVLKWFNKACTSRVILITVKLGYRELGYSPIRL